MKTDRKSLTKVRRFVVNSVKQPQFLLDPTSTLTTKSLAWNGVYNILYLMLDGCTCRLIRKHEIDAIEIEVDRINADLRALVDDKQMLMIWIWIGELVEGWIKFAIENEEYEIAANLKKILDAC